MRGKLTYFFTLLHFCWTSFFIYFPSFSCIFVIYRLLWKCLKESLWCCHLSQSINEWKLAKVLILSFIWSTKFYLRPVIVKSYKGEKVVFTFNNVEPPLIFGLLLCISSFQCKCFFNRQNQKIKSSKPCVKFKDRREQQWWLSTWQTTREELEMNWWR